jgi:hypothetical protein
MLQSRLMRLEGSSTFLEDVSLFQAWPTGARLEVENGVYWIEEAWGSRDRNVQSCCVDSADCLDVLETASERDWAQQRKPSTCCDTRTKRLPM